MECPNCDGNVRSSWTHCPHCGANLKEKKFNKDDDPDPVEEMKSLKTDVKKIKDYLEEEHAKKKNDDKKKDDDKSDGSDSATKRKPLFG